MGKESRVINGNIRSDLKIDRTKFYVRNFESLEKFYDFCETEITEPEEKGYVWASHSERSRDKESRGTKNWEEAVRLARFGWPEGLIDLDYYEEMSARVYG